MLMVVILYEKTTPQYSMLLSSVFYKWSVKWYKCMSFSGLRRKL